MGIWRRPSIPVGWLCIEVFRAHNVGYFIYIGGNDSAETAHILNELAVEEGYDVRLFHVPKTIDTDLRVMLYDHLNRLSFSFYDRTSSGHGSDRPVSGSIRTATIVPSATGVPSWTNVYAWVIDD